MSNLEFGSVVSLGISLSALWAVYYFVHKPSCVTSFREDLFDIRRDLFMIMARGEIEATNPAYVRLRWTLNGLLRFAEKFGLARLLIIMALVPRPSGPDLDNLFQTLQPSVRNELDAIRIRLGSALVKHILVRSPLFTLSLLVVVPVCAIYVFVTSGIGKSIGTFRSIPVIAEPFAERISSEAHLSCECCS